MKNVKIFESKEKEISEKNEKDPLNDQYTGKPLIEFIKAICNYVPKHYGM